MTTNISPEIGGRVTEHLMLGAGLDFQYAKVKFNQVIGSPAYLQAINGLGAPVGPMSLDSISYNQGDSFGMGFHAGILTAVNNDHTRIGLNYQSAVHHKFQGYSRLTGPLANPGLDITDPLSILTANRNTNFWSNNLSSNSITLPDIITLSAYHDVNEQLALLGSVVYTAWSCFETIELNQVAAFSPTLGQVLVNSTADEYYRDAWRFAVGANYKVNERWKVRLGAGYDQTPTTNANRDIRIADPDRWALSIGAHYQVRPAIGVDVGYTHLFAAGEVPHPERAVLII
jgi:long-chain fatty acid transport protein